MPINPNPITAAREVAPRDGLAGAVGLGVMLPEGGDPLDPNGRWPLGYQLWGPSCGSIQIGTLGICEPPPNVEAVPDDAPRWISGPPSAPFRLRAGIACSLADLAGDGLADWQAEAKRLLDLGQWTQIAHELWTGEQADRDGAGNKALASSGATVLGQAVGVVEAIARIEDALGVCSTGDTALIHVPRRLVPYLAAAGLISSVTGQTSRLFTHNGSLVIADRGYPGTGPNGQLPTPTGTWIYGTSVLSARIASATTYPAPDTGSAAIAYQNDAIVRAERKAAISWLCCHFAVGVTYC